MRVISVDSSSKLPKPEGLQVKSEGINIDLSWNPILDPVTNTTWDLLDRYIIYRSSDDGLTYKAVAQTKETKYRFRTDRPGTWTYKIIATDIYDKESDASDPVTIVHYTTSYR